MLRKIKQQAAINVPLSFQALQIVLGTININLRFYTITEIFKEFNFSVGESHFLFI